MTQLLGSTPSLSAHQLSTPLLLGIGVLALVELALLVIALISLIKRPAAEVRFHAKWPWAVLIAVVGVLGPLVYFAAGRIDAARPRDIDAGGARRRNARSAPPTCSTVMRTNGEQSCRRCLRRWRVDPACPPPRANDKLEFSRCSKP